MLLIPLFASLQEIELHVQGDTSGWSEGSVDIRTKISIIVYRVFTKCNLNFDVNKTLRTIWRVTLYSDSGCRHTLRISSAYRFPMCCNLFGPEKIDQKKGELKCLQKVEKERARVAVTFHDLLNVKPVLTKTAKWIWLAETIQGKRKWHQRPDWSKLRKRHYPKNLSIAID